MTTYKMRGQDPETDAGVEVWLGWREDYGYFLAVPELEHVRTAESITDLVNVSRLWVEWDEQMRHALINVHPDPSLQSAIAAEYVREFPNDPITKILTR